MSHEPFCQLYKIKTNVNECKRAGFLMWIINQVIQNHSLGY